jgi:Na+-translocating ferredoxin:NAD+ oxidoreductase RnfG subunit
MKSLAILIAGIVSILINSPFDDNIDYKPRLLLKELRSLTGSEDFQLRELQLHESLTVNNFLNGKFLEVMCKEKRISTVYVGRVNSCRAGGCFNQLKAENEGEFEYFDYFILFDLNNKITAVRVYNYAATHGQEITARGWLNQFTGYDGKVSLRVGKEIDSISGATISVRGLVADVQEKADIVKRLSLIQAEM